MFICACIILIVGIAIQPRPAGDAKTFSDVGRDLVVALITTILAPILAHGLVAFLLFVHLPSPALIKQERTIAEQGMTIAEQGMTIAEQEMTIAEQGMTITYILIGLYGLCILPLLWFFYELLKPERGEQFLSSLLNKPWMAIASIVLGATCFALLAFQILGLISFIQGILPLAEEGLCLIIWYGCSFS